MNKLVISVLLAIVATACSKKQEAVQAEKPAVVTGVRLETTKAIAIDDFYEAVGTVHSQTATTLSSKIVGGVTAMRVREGERVRAGQVLVEIENRDARAQLEKAQAGLREAQTATEEVEKSIRAAEASKTAAEAQRALAEATFKRYQALLERQAVSLQEFDEARARQRVAEAEAERADRLLQAMIAKKNQVVARIEQAKAEVASAQVQAGYARLVAPISGVVTAKHADIGSLAAPGAPLLTIEDSARYRLEVAVEEAKVRDIRLGAAATVLIDALGGAELVGRVAEIVPAADPASRSYTLKIAVPMQTGLRSGLFGKARFRSGAREALTIPQSALAQRGQLTGVYVVDAANIARLRLLSLGKTRGERVEVLAGLNNGELIIVEGAARVSDGSKVQ
jgi:multidrug efflux pump subunit AcrA (membrane-fusion protein)